MTKTPKFLPVVLVLFLTAWVHGAPPAVVNATDNFNRADGALGPNWTTSAYAAAIPPTIHLNGVIGNVGSSNWSTAYWSANTFANDQFSQASIVGGNNFGVVVRHGTAGVSNFYAFLLTAGNAYIFIVNNGAFTQLATASSVGYALGNVMRLEVAGTTLTAKLNGTTILTTTDATYASGSPGIAPLGNTDVMDDWSGGPVTATTVFTALHTYYISPTGSDAANGLTPATAWATPNHTVVCGDVIIAKAGTYSGGQFSQSFGTVNSCPSTSGGIDGTGGIYFAVLLCEGPDLVSCPVTPAGVSIAQPMIGFFGNTNWAVEGFVVPNATSDHRAFEIRNVDAPCTGAFSTHHIASINNVFYDTRQGVGTNDCGRFGGVNPPAADYLAAIGTIAQNAVEDTVCLAAIDFAGGGPSDAATTAIKGIMYGNFTWNNFNTFCDARSDNGGFLLDTLDAHNSNGIWNIFNNMSWWSGRYGVGFFWQCASSAPFTVNFFNNTAFSNNAGQVTNGQNMGEIFAGTNAGCSVNPVPVTVNITKNIAKSHFATSPVTGFATIYALFVDAANSNLSLLTNGTTGNENIWKGMATSCAGSSFGGGCDPGNNITWTFAHSQLGTNFYTDPLFANETDLLTNRLGAPNCTGFTNVTACMGWNAKTSTLTTPSPISDLAAGCAQCAGKGYQLPSTVCTANANYPTWLKGIVYLRVVGSQIIQDNDLVTKPCGL